MKKTQQRWVSKNKPQGAAHSIQNSGMTPRVALHPILRLQQISGNRAVGSGLRCGLIQAKLRIGRTHDRYEQEADRVAEQILRMRAPVAQPNPT